jgi:hypothetical protein
MNRQTMIVLLLLVAIASVAYAIYRSTADQTILIQGGIQTIYNQPQHGLILGLCILAGLCVLATLPLILIDRQHYDFDDRRRDADRIGSRDTDRVGERKRL